MKEAHILYDSTCMKNPDELNEQRQQFSGCQELGEWGKESA